MSVPKQRHTKARRDRKRQRFAVSKKNLQECSHCGKLTSPHKVCSKCGHYKNKEVVNTIKKAKKKNL